MTENESAQVELLSLEQAAGRIGRKRKTLFNWISMGKLGGAQGLCYVAGKPMIDWTRFAAAYVRRAA